MRRVTTAMMVMALSLGLGCSGGGGGNPTVAAANAETNYTSQLANSLGLDLAALSTLFDTIFDPDAAAAAGVTFVLDDGPGVAPHTYDVQFPYDQNQNGTTDTTIIVRIVFNEAPGDAPRAGLTATLTLTAPLVGFDGTASGNGTVEWLTVGIRVSGDVTIDDRSSGRMIDVTIDPANPLTIKEATGDPDSQANVCDMSAEGTVGVTITSAQGILSMIWNLLSSSGLVNLSDISFAAADETNADLPNQDVALDDCGVTIDTWVGAFVLEWNCIPLESGITTHTFEKISSTQLRGTAVEDDAVVFTYTLNVDPNNPRVATGTFSETDSGGTYVETFRYTIAPHGNSWTQDNRYEYQSGPLQGSGGDCFGTATRD